MKKFLTSVALTLVTLSSFANYGASFKACTATYTINWYDESGHYLGSNVGISDGSTCAEAMATAKRLAQAYPLY